MRLFFLLAALLCGLLHAEDFWKAKPFSEWNEKEVRRMLTNSPWAKEVEVHGAAPGMGGGRGGGRTGPNTSVGGADTMGAGAEASGGGGRGAMGGAMPSNPASMLVSVRWQSALPVRQALVRRKFGEEAATAADAKTALEAPPTAYVVAVEGLPQRMAMQSSMRLEDRLKKSASLRAGSHAPLEPADVRIGMVEKHLVIYFFFPRPEESITLADKDAEFQMRAGPMEVKRKFKLADMTVDGKLAL